MIERLKAWWARLTGKAQARAADARDKVEDIRDRADEVLARAESWADRFAALTFLQRFLIILAFAVVSASIYNLAFSREMSPATVGKSGHVLMAVTTGKGEWIVAMREADNCPAGKRVIYLSPMSLIQGCYVLIGADNVFMVFEDGDTLELPRRVFKEIGKDV